MMSELPGTSHVLSKKSQALCRDTFIFWGKPAQLLIGLNQKRTPVTAAKLRRWIRLMDPTAEDRDIDLRPALIEKFGPLLYYTKPAGPTVPSDSDSTHILPTGNYGWFNFDGPAYHPFYSVDDDQWSFARFKRHSETDSLVNWDHVPELYVFPPSYEKSVHHRDTCCFITGTKLSENEQSLGVTWIVPPPWAPMLVQPPNPFTSEIIMRSILLARKTDESLRADFISVCNVGLMRQDLISLFHDNAFGVDVDDDYRIIVFRDIGSVKLPSHLPRIQSCPGPGDRFLREHFRCCLLVYIFGGDINEEYKPYDIIKAAEELGLSDDDRMLPLSDERWQSVLGKELLEDHIKTTLFWSRYRESQDTEETHV